MATIAFLSPFSAELPSSNFPELLTVNGRPALAFDATINESALWTAIAPQSITGALTALVWYAMALATSGDVDVDVSVEAVTDGDSLDFDAAESFDTVNSMDNTTVPGTAGYSDVVTVTLTNKDSIAAGDYFRVKLTRDAASDTASGDMYVFGVELRDES